MMNGAKKSDSLIIPAKPANKAGPPAAEPVEGSSGTERNAELQSTVRTQSREAVSQAQDRIRGAVTRNKKEKLTALLHHITVDILRRVFFKLKKRAAPGVDGVTWEDYAADLDRNLTDLHARVHRGAYRALPSRRRYIPKADGKQRPLGIAAIEDKIVQAAVVALLTPIYEAEFLGFSYGFRPGRSQHDADRFLNDLKDRLAKFALSLHPEKTRLIEFGRYAAERRADRGKGKPETFDFLGFTHYCSTKKDSADFQLGRKTQRKRMKAKLREIKETLRQHRHKPIDEQGRWLATVIKGYFAYFAVPTNTYLLSAFRYHISMKWFQSLRRRSQRHRLTWKRMTQLIDRFLPSPCVLHPWPDQRFGVTYSR